MIENNEQLPGQTNLFDDTFAGSETPYYDAAADLEAEKQAIESAADEWAQEQEAQEEKSDVGFEEAEADGYEALE